MERTQSKRERGSSLLEVLIAMGILMFLLIGVLSMFSAAYLVNMGASARTDMTYKAQQVADAVRYLNTIQHAAPTSLPSSSITGLTFPLALTSTPVKITTKSGANLQYGYWGPPTSTLHDTANIVDPAFMPYDITVGVSAPNGVGLVTVTVSVIPNSKTSNPTGRRYQGTRIQFKEVDYVTQLPQ
jgi:hypothetical protein